MLDRLLIKFPTRERPEQALRVLQAFEHHLSEPAKCMVLLTIDADDRSMDAFEQKVSSLAVPITIAVGQRTSKIGAVNRDMHLAGDWDIVLVASDDMMPVCHGLDRVIRERMQDIREDGDACLWFSDGRQERVCTYPIMGRTWYGRKGHIYHPGYRSYYADDEQTETALLAGRMLRDNRVLLRHDHACWDGGLPNDALYDHNRRDKSADRTFYTLRRAAGYP